MSNSENDDNSKFVHKDNLNIMIITHIIINSIRNKFVLLTEQIRGNADFLISETLDDLFQIRWFLVDGFSALFTLDWDRNGGESKASKSNTKNHLQALRVNLNIYFSS